MRWLDSIGKDAFYSIFRSDHQPWIYRMRKYIGTVWPKQIKEGTKMSGNHDICVSEEDVYPEELVKFLIDSLCGYNCCPPIENFPCHKCESEDVRFNMCRNCWLAFLNNQFGGE